MSRVELEPCFVLHRRAYRETSLLVEAFSAVHGRVGLVARGARRASSRLRALLQPFCPLLLSWTGRGELATLAQAEAAGRAPGLTGLPLVSGLYMNELLMRLLHRHDPHPDLYQGYCAALHGLGGDEHIAPEPILRVFEKQLLDEIGYGLVLDCEADADVPIDPQVVYDYRREQGPCRIEAGAGEGVPVSGSTLLALRRGQLSDPRELREAKRLMRFLLDQLLDGRALHSRSLLRGVAGSRTPRTGI